MIEHINEYFNQTETNKLNCMLYGETVMQRKELLQVIF